MYEPLQLLLLNAFFLIAPLFLMQQIDDRTFIHKHRNVVGLLSAACIVVACMSFPIRISPDFIIDLRWIPLYLVHIYLGPIVSIPLLGFIAGYRLAVFGLDGAFMLFALTVVFLIPPKLFRRATWSVRRKSVASAAIAIAYGLVCSALMYSAGYVMEAGWSVPLSLVQPTVAATMTLLIENWLRKDEASREQRLIMSEKLEKFDLVSQLAASVSHEVRNPLTVTRGFLQLLRTGGQSERERQQYISLALEELDRAQDIITDYLSFAKQEPGNEGKVVFDAGDELEKIANVIKPYALIHSVLVETDVEADCSVRGHAGKFRQCVVNLCKNAIESMPRAGTVRIALSRDDGRKEALLSIQDEGVGMDRGQLGRIGTAYATTKENGTGLGLSVVCRVVEEMGGRIRFVSEVGRGTTVYVHLPLEPGRVRWEEPYDAREPHASVGSGA